MDQSTPPLDILRATKARMDLEQLIYASSTDRTSRADAKFELRRRIDRQLVHFGLDPAATLEAMEKYGAIISGSVALAVLFPDDDTFFGNDIDFFVSEENLPRFQDDIIANSNYRVVRDGADDVSFEVGSTGTTPDDTPLEEQQTNCDRPSSPYPCIYANRIVWLKDDAVKGRAMNIIEPFDDEPMRVITTFYSTLLMNAITHLGVVCLYPELTMARVGAVKHPVFATQPRIALNIRKYALRGFDVGLSWNSPEVLDILGEHTCGRFRCCPWTVRDTRVDDSVLWMSYLECPGIGWRKVVPTMRWSHHIAYDFSGMDADYLTRDCASSSFI